MHQREAKLTGASLTRATLRQANLERAELSETDLSETDMGEANLDFADLGAAILSGANLDGATLGGAILEEADLIEASLRQANLRGADLVLQLPFNGLSVWLLRKMGARIGNNVYISAGVWIDSLFPDLLTIEDNVLLGVGVKIALHEFRIDEFVARRVTIRRGAIIGGFSLIGPGTEIGENATVAGGAVIARDVPPSAVAGGNPARVVAG